MEKYLQSTGLVPFQKIVDDGGKAVKAGTIVPGVTYHEADGKANLYYYAVTDKEYIEYDFDKGTVTANVIGN